jgi:hypothetical protein
MHGAEGECIYDFGGNGRKGRPLGRTRCRWDDNIKIELREIGWSDLNWISLAEEPSGFIKC